LGAQRNEKQVQHKAREREGERKGEQSLLPAQPAFFAKA